jgi:Ca2+-binding EF-hand superfamily protein
MSRLFAATIGGVAVTALGWQLYAQQAESKSAASALDVTRLPAYKRFLKFASVVETKKAGPDNAPPSRAMSVRDFVMSLTTGPSARPISDEAADAIFNSASVQKYLTELVELIDNDRSGTIDFPEYLTLHTLLAIPVQELRSALEMFDRPNNRRVTLPQFNALLRAMSAGKLGAAPTASKDDNRLSSLAGYFFGPDGSRTVTFDDFIGRLADVRRLVRSFEFECALVAEAQRAATAQERAQRLKGGKASIAAIRARLVGTPADSGLVVAAEGKVPDALDETAPLVTSADFAVMMALLASSDDWTHGLRLYLRKDGNAIDHAMLRRVLTDVDISARIPAGTQLCVESGARAAAAAPSTSANNGNSAESKSTTTSSGGGWFFGLGGSSAPAAAPAAAEKSQSAVAATAVKPVRVYPSARHAQIFSQLMDQNDDGTIDVAEIKRVARAHTSFFAPFELSQALAADRNVVQQWVYCMQQK